ncbi:response regulator transcription factor [Variovorax ginsengisoli]|uniref:Two-component system response regulator DesR n=1 Tax=Variovorax ginsengisoli TaxID=363844 RepID=A0ABT9SG99_9BURK|nr:response regulator transcription factor [Variovorax ginsengisoli]MDP9902417.1 two-component system response regulator DesR [Variovorax ginsengisoli]
MNEVLIVEDHPFVAEATKRLLSANYPLLNAVVLTNADDAVKAVSDPHRAWHRILLDLDVPGAHGLSVAAEVQKQGLAGISCVVTGNMRSDYIDAIEKMGFLGYIGKGIEVREFADSLALIFVGDRSFPSDDTCPFTRADSPRITLRQREVLDLVRCGCNSKEIGRRLHLSPGTVNNHINALMAALEVNSRSHAVGRAIELGMLSMHAETRSAWY